MYLRLSTALAVCQIAIVFSFGMAKCGLAELTAGMTRAEKESRDELPFSHAISKRVFLSLAARGRREEQDRR